MIADSSSFSLQNDLQNLMHRSRNKTETFSSSLTSIENFRLQNYCQFKDLLIILHFEKSVCADLMEWDVGNLWQLRGLHGANWKAMQYCQKVPKMAT